MNTKPLYIVIAPQTQLPTVEREIHFWPSHIQTFSYLGETKQRKERKRASIRMNSSWSFNVTSAGHPIAWSTGAQLRRATPEDAAAYDAITERINQLYKDRSQLCRDAHGRGDMVHKSEAVNFNTEEDEASQ